MSGPLPTRLSIPKLASDARRGWISLTVVLPVMLIVGPLMLAGRSPAVGAMAQLLVAWVAFALIQIVLTLWAFRGLTGERLRVSLLYGDRTESRMVQWMLKRPVLRTFMTGGDAIGWAVQMSLVAFAAALALAVNSEARTDLVVVCLGIGSVAVCWGTVVVSYALHYARSHFRHGGLRFPGDEPTSFGEFLYLAVMVSASFGTSDVQVHSRAVRRTVTTHSLIAFAYNTVIVAVLVSVLVGAVS
ncbi:DUF1345 domain-containing protein [Propionibacteriaceae bacterium Y1685]|uniref:DUF1345 domain-containing protein n=1 Tax=Microlunatus sp. Y1700 TaxID=3418487 RepID=UPI003B7F165A